MVSIDIDIDPGYGFVRALRSLRNCPHRTMKVDSIAMHIHMDSRGDAKKFLECVSSVEGYASIDIKLCLSADDEKALLRTLRSIGYSIVPRAISTRIAAMKRVEGGAVIVERTSRPGTYLLRLARGSRIEIPIPPSTYVVVGPTKEACTSAQRVAEALEQEFRNIAKALPSAKPICLFEEEKESERSEAETYR